MEELLVEIEKIVEKVNKRTIEETVDKAVKKSEERIKKEIKEDLEQQIKGLGLKVEFDIERKIDIILDYITLQQEKDVENIRKIHQLEKRMEQNEIQILDHKNRIVVLEEKMINK